MNMNVGISIGIYLKEIKESEKIDILFTVGTLGWEEETKRLVDEDFESITSKIEARFGEKLKIKKKSAQW